MTAVARHATLGDAAVLMLEFAASQALSVHSPQLAAPCRGGHGDHPCDGDPVVVELGPGTGAFTEAIQARLGTRGRHIAVELNPRLATLTASRHRGVDMVHASADTLPEILADRGIANADFIVSGLPWVSMPAPVAEATLDAARSVLAPDGAFTTFGYTLVRGFRRAALPAHAHDPLRRGRCQSRRDQKPASGVRVLRATARPYSMGH